MKSCKKLEKSQIKLAILVLFQVMHLQHLLVVTSHINLHVFLKFSESPSLSYILLVLLRLLCL